jgi:Flagellar P-ring protein/HEAT repeats
MKRRPAAPALACFAVAALAGVLVSCSAPPKAKSVQAVVRDTPPLLRGTVGTEVEFNGVEPILVSGLGLVVGLDGTGGDTLPDNIAATMEREMGLRGVSKSNEDGSAFAGKSPREVLRDKNVAVVLVQASIPPGSPANATFDVYVTAINASSLEGGTLFTTDLQLGKASTFGAVASHKIAVAKGPIFINPFADLSKENAGVTPTTGRVLDGGQVTSPLKIEMALNNSSFARTRAIVSAINSRFPTGPGDPVTTARGRNGPDLKTGGGGSIELHVPTRYRKEPAEFLSLVRHVQIDQGAPEQWARRYVEGVKSEPALGEDLSWCLEALGPKATPFLRELYDYPELVPRLAALKAGARLDDPYAVPHLTEVTKSGSGGVRTQAIKYLGLINGGPKVDEALRELLDESELDVRIAAYEALVERAERSQLIRYENFQQDNPDAPRFSPTHLQVLASRSFASSVQGIQRTPVEGKFLLDVVPFGEPLIYITQQGHPRIVLFGDPDKGGLELVRPMVVTLWQDRLMMTSDLKSDQLHVRYLAPGAERAVTQTVKANLPQLIHLMATRSTPDDPHPGLDMSYSEIVGALSAVQQGKGTLAAFATETDRMHAQLASARSSRQVAERPETPEDRQLVILHRQEEQAAPTPSSKPAQGPRIVPIQPPDTKKKG